MYLLFCGGVLLGSVLLGSMLLGGVLLLGSCLLLVALCFGCISLGKRVTTNVFFGLVDTFTTSRVANTNSRGLTALLGGGSLFSVSLLGFSSSLLTSLLGGGVLLGLFSRAVLLGLFGRAVLLGGGMFLGGGVLFGGSLFIVLDRNVT